jgi:conjugative relaxase-like TrwC/TraI family protein
VCAAVVVSVKAQGVGGWRYHEGSAGAARDEIGNTAARAADNADLAGYYGSDGTRPGRWVGTAEDLARYRLGVPRSAVAREQLSRVLDEGRLGDGTGLGVQRSKRALYDVTFSAPKSVSVLWSDAAAADRVRIEEAVLRSAEAVLADLSAHACQVRRGKAPATRQLEGRGLVAAAYVEGTSRAGDPQLHVHMLVPSTVEGGDGKWSRLDARALYPESRTADAVAHAVLRRELTDAVGVGWGPVNERTGAAEVLGVDLAEVEHASKRRAQVEAYVAEHRGGQEAAKGRPLTAHELTALRQEACLRTRAGKDVHATETVVAGWQDGRDIRTGRSREQRWAGYERAWAAAREHAASTLTGQPVSLRGEALLAETARRVARPSFTAAQVRRVAAQLLDPAVPAGRVLDAVDAAGRDALTHAVDLSPDDVQVPAGQRRYATEAQLAAELDIALLAEAGRSSRAGGVSEPAGRLAEAPDAAGRSLDVEQAAAVRALTAPGRVRVLVAPAGAGKTFVLAQAVRAWQHDGRQVVLLAAQGKAADVAAAEIGRAAGQSVPAMTLARAFGTDDSGPHGEQARRWQAGLAAAARARGAVLLVDEAGVVDTAMLARVLTWSAAHDVAVRLVGDPKQQQAIGAGGMFGYLARDGERTVELGTVRRFTDPAEGPASVALRVGDPAALDFYQAHDRIQAVDGAAAAVREAVVAAAADRTAGRHTLIVTASDRQRREAAEASHQLVIAEHAAAGDEGDVRRYGRLEVAVGEPVRARRNHYGLVDSAGAVLRNGSDWTVGAVTADGIDAVRRDDPTVRITLPADYVREHVEHGYAITAYRGQGLTCDRSHIVGAEQMSREALYVAMTRARDGGRLLVPAADPVEAGERLADALGRVGEHHAALDLLTDLLNTAREDTRQRPGLRSEPSGPTPAPTGADPAPDTTAPDRTAREVAAERARRTADELRQRRDQLRSVLGTDTSPARPVGPGRPAATHLTGAAQRWPAGAGRGANGVAGGDPAQRTVGAAAAGVAAGRDQPRRAAAPGRRTLGGRRRLAAPSRA